MGGLTDERQSDYMFMRSQQSVTIERAELALLLPESFEGKIKMRQLDKENAAKAAIGRTMTDDELSKLNRVVTMPLDLIPFGWIGENIEPGGFLGVEFLVNQ